jgi:hypothetical protein
VQEDPALKGWQRGFPTWCVTQRDCTKRGRDHLSPLQGGTFSLIDSWGQNSRLSPVVPSGQRLWNVAPSGLKTRPILMNLFTVALGSHFNLRSSQQYSYSRSHSKAWPGRLITLRGRRRGLFVQRAQVVDLAPWAVSDDWIIVPGMSAACVMLLLESAPE